MKSIGLQFSVKIEALLYNYSIFPSQLQALLQHARNLTSLAKLSDPRLMLSTSHSLAYC